MILTGISLQKVQVIARVIDISFDITYETDSTQYDFYILKLYS